MGEEFKPAQLKKILEEARERLLRVPGVEKVDLLGVQDERIWVEVSSRRLASFGLSVQTVIDAITRDNAVAAAGSVDLTADRVFIRVDEGFDTAAAVRAAPIPARHPQLTVGDLAEITRGSFDPQV